MFLSWKLSGQMLKNRSLFTFMQTVSVVAPCYNEQAVLPELFYRLSAAAATWGADYEVVCVDDGSQDETWKLLKQQHAADSRWCGLSFAGNLDTRHPILHCSERF